MTLQNFRRYSNAVTIEFENLTAFVGKNDAGKSSILEALDIFFNEGKGCVKIDKDDINPPLLFVFGKDIEEKLIYIKLKVKNKTQKHVLCVSFHYAKEKMIFPYAQP